MRSEYFFGFILSFIVGVALESLVGFGYSCALLFALTASVILLHDVRMIPPRSFLVSLILFGCALGIFRIDVSSRAQDPHVLDRLAGETVRAQGIVFDEPDVREGYTNIVLEVRHVLYEERDIVLERPVKILARIPAYPQFRYGDEVVLVGKIALPKNFTAEGGQRAFDYRAYLAKDDIHYQMFFPKISLIAHTRGNIVYEKLFALKEILMNNITRTIAEPEASLAGGVLLGAKRSLGEDLLQKFRETGVAHIVVLSGYNIAVVAGVVARTASFLPFVARISVSVIAVILFAIMVGGEATVVRATIMVLVVILSRVTGRESDALRALVLAGGLMVFANPTILLFDVSFQLSFVATLALVIFVPVVEKYFLFISNTMLREICVTTFATQLFVLPLILFYMGNVSLIGLVANIFILPVIPLAMLTTSFVAMFAWMPLISSVVAFCAYLVLAYVIFAVEFFARVPFASLHNVPFPLGALMLAYVLLGFYIVKNFSHSIVEEKSEYEF